MWQRSRGWRNRSYAKDLSEIPEQSKVTVKSELLKKNGLAEETAKEAAVAEEAASIAAKLQEVTIDTDDLLTELPPIDISSAENAGHTAPVPGAGDETRELPIFKEHAEVSSADSAAVSGSEDHEQTSGRRVDAGKTTTELPLFKTTAEGTSVSADTPESAEACAAETSGPAEEHTAEDANVPKSAGTHSDEVSAASAEAPESAEEHTADAPELTVERTAEVSAASVDEPELQEDNAAGDREDTAPADPPQTEKVPAAGAVASGLAASGAFEGDLRNADEHSPAGTEAAKDTAETAAPSAEKPKENAAGTRRHFKGEKIMDSHVLVEAEKQTAAMEALAVSDSAEIANGGPHEPKATETTLEQKIETYRMKYERVLERCLVLGRQVQDLQIALAKSERALQENLIDRRKMEDSQKAVIEAEGRVNQAKKMIDSILADSRRDLADATAKLTKQTEIADRAENAKTEAEKRADEAVRRAENAEEQLHELARAGRREQKQLLKKISVMW